MKALFAIVPFIALFFAKKSNTVFNLIGPISSLNYFIYSGYFMVTVHYTYFTAFIQFFMGIVLFYRFSVRSFLITYSTGLLIFFYSLNLMEGIFAESEYLRIQSDTSSAIIPIYIFSVLFFFIIRRKEEKEQVTSMFFQRIGENMGFILHEIRGSVAHMDQSPANSAELEEVKDILQISHIMWPDKNNRSLKMEEKEFSVKKLIERVLEKYSYEIEKRNIDIKMTGEFYSLNKNKQVMRIILKNLVQNAIEEIILNDVENSELKIVMPSNKRLVIINSCCKKPSISAIKRPGTSSKKTGINHGLGLYIVDELARNAGISVNLSVIKNNFQAELVF